MVTAFKVTLIIIMLMSAGIVGNKYTEKDVRLVNLIVFFGSTFSFLFTEFYL